MGFHCLDFNANKYEVWLMIHISHMIYISCSRMPDPRQWSLQEHTSFVIFVVEPTLKTTRWLYTVATVSNNLLCSYTFLICIYYQQQTPSNKSRKFSWTYITCKGGCNLGSRSSSGWSWLASGTRRSEARPWTRPRPYEQSMLPSFPWRQQGIQQRRPMWSAEQPRVPSWPWARRCSLYTAPHVTSTWTGIRSLASQFAVQIAL